MLVASALVVSMATATPVAAQEAPAPSPVDAITKCREIQDPTARLTCFDTAAAALAAAQENKDLVILNRAEVQTTRRSLFGFSLPRIRLFGGDDDGRDNPEDIQEISGTVTSVAQVSHDRWSFILDDKTRWITTDSAQGFPPRAGENVVIRRAALGSFNASFNKRRFIKVRRTQ